MRFQCTPARAPPCSGSLRRRRLARGSCAEAGRRSRFEWPRLDAGGSDLNRRSVDVRF
jgi:hypothetical protein